VLNSAALSLAGIGMETPDPPGGIIDRDLASGEPNGILFEMLGYIREKVMPPLSARELDEALAKADRHYLSCGITSLQDASVSNDFHRWQIFRGFKESGKLHPRLVMMTGDRARRQFQEVGLTTGSGDSRLRLGAVKIMLTETSGKLRPPQDELNRQVLECHQSGFQIAFHAVQESATEAAASALEYADRHLPVAGRRHRIEHCAECPPRLLERLKRLGVVIVTQPPFIYESGERYLATVADSQQPWLYRIRSMMQGSLTVAGSSDSPVAGDNPLAGIYAAVTRRTASGIELLPEEGISPAKALEMYTVNAARASFEEESKGSIAPGKLADLLVLSEDPTRVPVESIKNIRVMMTIIGGRVAWEG
jgi:predicted amidohydrolase YtcJ